MKVGRTSNTCWSNKICVQGSLVGILLGYCLAANEVDTTSSTILNKI